jgi:hypothetical protein
LLVKDFTKETEIFSFIYVVAFYALNIIDANVDAALFAI